MLHKARVLKNRARNLIKNSYASFAPGKRAGIMREIMEPFETKMFTKGKGYFGDTVKKEVKGLAGDVDVMVTTPALQPKAAAGMRKTASGADFPELLIQDAKRNLAAIQANQLVGRQIFDTLSPRHGTLNTNFLNAQGKGKHLDSLELFGNGNWIGKSKPGADKPWVAPREVIKINPHL